MKIKMFDGVDVTFTEMTARVLSRVKRKLSLMAAKASVKDKDADLDSKIMIEIIGDSEQYEEIRDCFFKHILIEGVGILDNEERFEVFFKKYDYMGEIQLFTEAIKNYVVKQNPAGENDSTSRPAADIQG